MRQHRSLAGSWQFQLDPQGTLELPALAPDREIPVPLPWQAAFPELQQYSGYAWYRRSFTLDSTWLEGELLLHFGAVDYWCQVFVNGQLAGEHEGGYTPFTFPIRRYTQPGANEIAVRVYDSVQSQILIPRWPAYSAGTGTNQPPFDAPDIPHGKQEWYINVGGIWQDVCLMAVPALYIDHVLITPNIHTGQVDVALELGGTLTRQLTGVIHLDINADDNAPAQADTTVIPGQAGYPITATVSQPRYWNVENPYLYTATVRLETSFGVDQISIRFGFREITTRDGRLLLNGEPIFLLSALDQDLYPDTIYTVPSVDYLRDEFQKAKALGLNCLRCHIKPPDPRYLDLADELGLLIWAEIPSWRTFAPKGTVHANQLHLDETIKCRAERTLADMIRRDYNHPSLVLWTLINEDWGTALPLSADDRAWVGSLYDRCKQLDPTRLVVDNSACLHSWGPNVHVKSDLDDFHIYANIPDHAESFEQAIEQFNLRPAWTYSQQGDAQRTGQEPLVLSEFGNWGLPSLRLLREHYGGDPPWFQIGPWWSIWRGEAGWAAGVDERFQKLGLGAIWPDYEQFATATQWHQFAALKFEIETLRRQPALAGYVITELTDIYWESNGLLDFLRLPKVYHEQFASINSPDLIIPQTDRYAYWDDQSLVVCLHTAHYSAVPWSGARLHWRLEYAGSSGEYPLPDLQRGTTRLLGTKTWDLARVQEPQTARLEFALESPESGRVARNWLDVLVLPAAARQPAYQQPLAVITRPGLNAEPALDPSMLPTGAPTAIGQLGAAPEGTRLPDVTVPDGLARHDLEHVLHRLGYATTTRLTPDTAVTVSNYPNAELLQWVRQGGKLLFLSTNVSPFFWVQRRSGAYAGSWITSFSWLRPGICRRLPVSNPLGLPFLHAMPNAVILGLPVEDPAVQADFLAGMISGWVRHSAIHTVQFRYGRGRVIMTTFALSQSLRYDPVAVALFHDLIDHLASDACQPVLTANC